MHTIIKLNRIKTVGDDELQKHLSNGWKVVETDTEALGDHHPDLDHMGIDELRQFARENGVELSATITNPDTARRRITEALGGEM